MNKKNILRVADAIEKGELVKRGIGFNMEAVISIATDRRKDHVDSCGTVACIAGWAHCVRYPRRKLARLIADTEDYAHYESVAWESAVDFLGLSEETADDLFQPSGAGPWTYITPAQAVRVLRHLAETGKVDWSVGAP